VTRLSISPIPFLAIAIACSEYEFKGEDEKTWVPEEDSALDSSDSAAPIPELCNGIDDNGNGWIDEGYPDTDADGTADCVDVEECDGIDNDGDGEIDEDFDTDGDGTADCLEVETLVEISLTADDAWQGQIDGTVIGEHNGWNQVDSFAYLLDSGSHLISIHAWDEGLAIAGFMAQVTVDGSSISLTGDGSWRITSGDEPTGWDQLDFDDSSWGIPVACADTSPWGGAPTELLDTGAQWVWYNLAGDCRASDSLSHAWLRLEFDLP
jgi:hypothetical protein